MAGETVALAEYIERFRLEDMTPVQLTLAKEHILDTFGALIFGSRSRLIGPVVEAIVNSQRAPGENTVVGLGRKAPLLAAISANSALSHCAEIDDIHDRSAVCMGGLIIPPILALAEHGRYSGPEVIEAIVVGYETAARAGESIDAPNLYAHGWWPSALCDGLGAAGGVAKLLRLSPDGIQDALGIAGMLAGGLLAPSPNEVMGRHILCGTTSQNGAMAALSADAGVSGPRDIFERQGGFCRTFTLEPRFDVLIPRRGEVPRICQTSIKPYGCARQTHAAVSGLTRLMSERGISDTDIEALVLSLPEQASFFDRTSPPKTRMQGMGSAQFTVALAAVEGTIRPLDFVNKLDDPKVLGLMGRVHFQTDRRLSAMYPDNWPAILRLDLKSGESITRELLVAPGDPADPLTGDRLLEKFNSLVEPYLGKEEAGCIAGLIMDLENAPSLSRLMERYSKL